MSLTWRETQVLQHLANGHSTREVAEKLRLNYFTVKHYRGSIIRHLGAKTLAHAINIALSEQLIEGDPWEI